jgi:hypothetical protein
MAQNTRFTIPMGAILLDPGPLFLDRSSRMGAESRRAGRPEPSCESLEGRVVLSTSHVATAAVPAALVHGVTYLFLNGSGHGTFSRSPVPIADVGVTDVFQGRALLGQLGTVTLAGSLTGTGFIAQGHATGTLTLKNTRGSVTLTLTGAPEGGFQAPQSGTYTFAVESGTGAYARTVGTGKVDLALGSGTFTMAFHGDPNRF